MLECLHSLHQLGYIHRNVSPASFLINEENKVFLIKLGNAKQYMVNEAHIAEDDPPYVDFTFPDIVSSWVKARRDMSRRDDVEMLGLTLQYLFCQERDLKAYL